MADDTKPKKEVFVPIADVTGELTQIVLDNQMSRSLAGIEEYRRKHNRPRRPKSERRG